MQFPQPTLLLIATATVTGVAANASPASCLGGLRLALVAGGFSGSTDCEQDRLSIRYVGEVESFGRSYKIYVNRYRLKPACPECAVHGGQRIIFMEHNRYLGQYKSDFADVTIRHGHLFIVKRGSPNPRRVQAVQFTFKGPPKSCWDGNDVLTFSP